MFDIKFFRSSIASILLASHVTVLAQPATYKANLESLYTLGDATTAQTQYTFKPIDERNLIPIRVIGAINKPGVHYVPKNADLLDLIGLAGGTTAFAEIEDISIRTKRSGKDEVMYIDGEKLFGTNKKVVTAPHLFPNDVVYIPNKQPFISDDTTRVVTILGAIASMILSVVLVRRELRRD